MPDDHPVCKGHDFQSGDNAVDAIMESMLHTGFQATNLGKAVEEVRRMRAWRLSDAPWKEGDDEALRDPEIRKKIRARLFFAYTSNQISCGQREVIRFLVQHNMVDVIVTTAGGIEEDIIKCFEPTYMGDFHLSGKALRKKGINRIGNLLVPNKNYCQFEDWMAPLISKMHDEQDERWAAQAQALVDAGTGAPAETAMTPFAYTPSEVIARLGKEINNEESVLYWAQKHDIPVFLPGAHGWQRRRHALFSLLQTARLRAGHRARHSPNQRPERAEPRHGPDHPRRRPREAPHVQRQPHAQRGRLLGVHQHRARV